MDPEATKVYCSIHEKRLNYGEITLCKHYKAGKCTALKEKCMPKSRIEFIINMIGESDEDSLPQQVA